jgi:anti-anti-sigma factor
MIEDVGYIDSTGIHALAISWVWASNAEGNLILVGLSEQVRHVLQLTKLYTVFRVCDNLSQALSALGEEEGMQGQPHGAD